MNSLPQPDARTVLLKIFSQALTAVAGRRCVSTYLAQCALPTARVRVVAIGKAAASMLQGVLEQHAGQVEAGLVITKAGHTADFSNWPVTVTQLESAHPYPDARSLAAGEQLLHFIRQASPEIGLLFLVSGGASSLVEVLPPGLDTQQLHDLNVWLLARGWPIDVMNQVRKSVSLIKAGRLARLLGGRKVLQLLISDVPGDDISVIGSGLLVANKRNMADVPSDLPDWLVRLQSQVTRPPAAADPCFHNIQSHIIASNELMRNKAVSVAEEMGYVVQCNAELSGDAAEQGRAIARRLLAGPPGIYLWGGETVVTLPEQPGQGGRCQQLALAAAQVLAAHNDCALLAAGSDGTDGPGDVAGALVDGRTLVRGHDAGAAEPDIALHQADAGRFLAASGDLVDTGPTGTNVMDLIIGLKA